MESFIWCLVGSALGSLITSAIYLLRTTTGTIRIDRSNPAKDLYRFDLNGPIDTLFKKDRVIFKVDHHADLSQ